MKNNESILLVVTGPSGAGKGTVLAKVMDELEALEFSVSVTTRKARYNSSMIITICEEMYHVKDAFLTLKAFATDCFFNLSPPFTTLFRDD